MRIIAVKSIRGGEILASPVYTEEKNIILQKSTILKSEYVDLLISLNIDFVEIEDVYHTYQYPVLLVSEEKKKEYVKGIRKLLENHIYTGKSSLKQTIKLAEKIISYVNGMKLDCVYDIICGKANLYEHTLRVTIFSLLLARKLQLSEKNCYNIAIGCLLHDLGLRYITVPYLNKQLDQTSPTEFFEYKKHTILAYTVVEGERDWLPDVSKNMILSHHEKMNGSGFPLKQRNQTIECKIIQLCDTFDCLISGMECKRCTVKNTMEYLWTQAGERYEKRLIEILFSMIAKYPVGTQVELSDGIYGIVSRQTDDPQRPVILMLTEPNGKVVPEKKYNLKENTDIHIKRII